jgi:hypothetical protein
MAGVRMAISIAMAAQDIGDLNDGPVRMKVSAGLRTASPLFAICVASSGST